MAADEKAVTEAAETARRYLDRILLEPLAEFGLLLKDKVSFWRFKNQVNTVLKAKSFLESKGIDPKDFSGSLDPELVVPLLEAASSTSDETLSTLFAGLLATTVQADAAEHMHKCYVQVLSNLSSLDAELLVNMKNGVEQEIRSGRTISFNNEEKVATYRDLGVGSASFVNSNVSQQQILLSFENIRRLGLGDHGTSFIDHVNRIDRMCFTDFGWSFMSAATKDVVFQKQ